MESDDDAGGLHELMQRVQPTAGERIGVFFFSYFLFLRLLPLAHQIARVASTQESQHGKACYYERFSWEGAKVFVVNAEFLSLRTSVMQGQLFHTRWLHADRTTVSRGKHLQLFSLSLLRAALCALRRRTLAIPTRANPCLTPVFHVQVRACSWVICRGYLSRTLNPPPPRKGPRQLWVLVVGVSL